MQADGCTCSLEGGGGRASSPYSLDRGVPGSTQQSLLQELRGLGCSAAASRAKNKLLTAPPMPAREAKEGL